MSDRPLKPVIKVTETPSNLGVCNCCGFESKEQDVKHVKFGWENIATIRGAGPIQGGGTAVALCHECRRKTIVVLAESL